MLGKASLSKDHVWISTICIVYKLSLKFRFMQIFRGLNILGQDIENMQILVSKLVICSLVDYPVS